MFQIFLINLKNTLTEYSGDGVRIYRTERGRFIVFNSKYASLRILEPKKRKVLARLIMSWRVDKQG